MKYRIAALGVLLALPLLVAQQTTAQATFTLKPTPKTVAWGYYDAKAAPVLRVKSGDTVEIQTLITNSPERLEKAGVPKDQVEQSLRDITEQVKDKGPGGHILTGPIYIEDAQPGDVRNNFDFRVGKIIRELPMARPERVVGVRHRQLDGQDALCRPVAGQPVFDVIRPCE